MVSNDPKEEEIDINIEDIPKAYYSSSQNINYKCLCTYKKLCIKEKGSLSVQESLWKSSDIQRHKKLYLIFNNVKIEIDDIIRMDDNTYSPILTIVLKNTSHTFIFQSLSDKIIIKTILYHNLLERIEAKYIESQLKLRVEILTWNVSESNYPEKITELETTLRLEDSDIMAIGLQECSLMQCKKWINNLSSLLSANDYVEIATENLFQMIILVFIKRKYYPLVSRIEKYHRALGFANLIGNKGGCIVSFYLMDYFFVFINSHLAPKKFKVLERNKMAKNIVEAFKVGDKIVDFDIQSDYTFWFGDLNYRLDFDFDETIKELAKRNISYLLTKDQLYKICKDNTFFHNFMEPQITFLPTYRRTKNEKNYELYKQYERSYIPENNNERRTRSNTVIPKPNQLNNKDNEMEGIFYKLYHRKETQSPSWCDRILIKTQRMIINEKYISIESITLSDHIPVVGTYIIGLTLPLVSLSSDSQHVHQDTFEKFKSSPFTKELFDKRKTTISTIPNRMSIGIINSSSASSYMSYKNITLKCYDFDQSINIDSPLDFTLIVYYYLQETPLIINKSIDKVKISNVKVDDKEREKQCIVVDFPDFSLDIQSSVLFGYSHIRFMNVFFALKVKCGKHEYTIGYTKYCFEDSTSNYTMLHQMKSLKLCYQLTQVGLLDFEVTYINDDCITK